MPSVRQAAAAAGRFASSVLMVSGVLLLLDAGATVVWQEPVSALLAEREQRRLDSELEQASAVLAAARPAVPREGGRPDREVTQRPRAARRRVPRHLEVPTPPRGLAIGRVELPTLGRSYAFVEGTSTGELRRGPGHFPGTALPGERGTVAIAGHRTTYGAPFRTIDRLRRGDRITVRMPYGRFSYRVERTRIVAPSALWVTRRVAHDRLVLTACHPLYSAAQRIVVFARAV
jgi:sortase A